MYKSQLMLTFKTRDFDHETVSIECPFFFLCKTIILNFEIGKENKIKKEEDVEPC